MNINRPVVKILTKSHEEETKKIKTGLIGRTQARTREGNILQKENREKQEVHYCVWPFHLQIIQDF